MRGSATKVLQTCVFLCMREDDQSTKERDLDSIFSPFLHLFVCVCVRRCEGSKHMHVKAFDKADTWA